MQLGSYLLGCNKLELENILLRYLPLDKNLTSALGGIVVEDYLLCPGSQ